MTERHSKSLESVKDSLIEKSTQDLQKVQDLMQTTQTQLALLADKQSSDLLNLQKMIEEVKTAAQQTPPIVMPPAFAFLRENLAEQKSNEKTEMTEKNEKNENATDSDTNTSNHKALSEITRYLIRQFVTSQYESLQSMIVENRAHVDTIEHSLEDHINQCNSSDFARIRQEIIKMENTGIDASNLINEQVQGQNKMSTFEGTKP